MATKKTESTQAPDKRDETTDGPVTELAKVSADTPTETLKQMAGVSKEQYKPAEKPESEASDQQKDVLEGLKQARDKAKHPEKDEPPVNPFVQGPGSDIG